VDAATNAGITSVSAGTITLAVFAGGVVLGYVAKRFKKGVDKSLLAEELERSGRLSGDVFGSALTRIYNWAEKYVPKQRELGGRVKKLRYNAGARVAAAAARRSPNQILRY